MTQENSVLNDHDVLITLNANFNTFVLQYQKDIKNLTDGTQKQLLEIQVKQASHNERISVLEKITAEVKPIETVKEFHILQKQVNDFIVGTKVARYFVGIISAIIGGVITLFGNYIFTILGIK